MCGTCCCDCTAQRDNEGVVTVTTTLIRNATIWDGTGAAAFVGDLLVEGNRIRSVSAAGARTAPGADVQIDARGRFLMPGMTEGHAHLSFDGVTATEDLIRPPPEEHTLIAARVARDAARPRLHQRLQRREREAAARRGGAQRDRGRRSCRARACAPAGPEITVTGGLGDEQPAAHGARQLRHGRRRARRDARAGAPLHAARASTTSSSTSPATTSTRAPGRARR